MTALTRLSSSAVAWPLVILMSARRRAAELAPSRRLGPPEAPVEEAPGRWGLEDLCSRPFGVTVIVDGVRAAVVEEGDGRIVGGTAVPAQVIHTLAAP